VGNRITLTFNDDQPGVFLNLILFSALLINKWAFQNCVLPAFDGKSNRSDHAQISSDLHALNNTLYDRLQNFSCWRLKIINDKNRYMTAGKPVAAKIISLPNVLPNTRRLRKKCD
jgi:hypothetical protein